MPSNERTIERKGFRYTTDSVPAPFGPPVPRLKMRSFIADGADWKVDRELYSVSTKAARREGGRELKVFSQVSIYEASSNSVSRFAVVSSLLVDEDTWSCHLLRLTPDAAEAKKAASDEEARIDSSMGVDKELSALSNSLHRSLRGKFGLGL